MTTAGTAEVASTSTNATINNRQFLAALGWAALALVLSALIVVALYVSFSPLLQRFENEATRLDPRPWKFAGADLVTRMGQGAREQGDALRVTELAKGIDNRAIFTRRTRLQAADYPFLVSSITDRHPGNHIYFIWRTQRAPDEVFYLPIYWSGDAPQTDLLAKHAEWRGTITEVGIDIYGELRDQGPLLRELALTPSSAFSLLRTIWDEWTAFREWTQKSAHHLRGTPPRRTQAVTSAMAAWAGTAVVLLLILGLARRKQSPVALALAIMVPWISLDMLWQKNLNTQLKETRYLFAGKSQHEKRLAELEHELYRYAQHLKNEVLPAPGARIFLLNKGPIRDYRRLKMQYYLLPHNVFNFGRFPRPDKLLPGDYLLVLDPIEGLEFDEQAEQLRWGGNSLDVTLGDSGEFAALYHYGGQQ